MTRDVVTLSPDASIRDAMALFATLHLSGAPVTSGDRILGIVSTTDLLAFAATCCDDPNSECNDGLGEIDAEAAAWEEESSPSTYFSTMWSDVGLEVDQRMRMLEDREWHWLDQITVADVMTPAPLVQLPPTATVHAAAAYMGRAAVHRLLVIDCDRLVGIVTTTDIARAVADRRVMVR